MYAPQITCSSEIPKSLGTVALIPGHTGAGRGQDVGLTQLSAGNVGPRALFL